MTEQGDGSGGAGGEVMSACFLWLWQAVGWEGGGRCSMSFADWWRGGALVVRLEVVGLAQLCFIRRRLVRSAVGSEAMYAVVVLLPEWWPLAVFRVCPAVRVLLLLDTHRKIVFCSPRARSSVRCEGVHWGFVAV